LQRRFQKIIEVAPAEGISEKVLEEMREASIKLGKASKLISLATIEFLYDPNEEKFYFMECNPRLQVEHTITEEITNIDLVKLQLEVIEGKALPKQESIRKNGVSIQARICAEVPEDDGRTGSGVITNYIIPEGLRLDSGIRACSIITNDFDSLLCKLIVNAENFSQARNKLKSALKDLVITGVPVSSGFLIKLLEYIKSFDTSYISSVGDFQDELELSNITEELYQVAAFFYSYVFSGFIILDKFQNTDPFVRNIRPREFQFLPLIEISLHQFETKKRLQIPSYIPFSKDFAIIRSSSDTFKTLSDGKESVIKLIEYNQSSELYLELSINSYHVLIAPAAPELKEGVTFEGDGVIIAPLPGTVLSILVKEGKEVKSGDVLISFDSMKTEHVLSAPCSGIIELVDVTIGGTIERGQLLIKISTNLKNK
jgi:acetyl/propionyl-CoA carboxylase alpha subunit